MLVHPDRNKVLINEPDILFEFVQKGILTQITASLITGKFGKKIKKFAFKYIETNWVHIFCIRGSNTKNEILS
ncbi:hypothetical protein [Gottfriedia acidiceleris]|uniref:hypothetical protein n=1 Tax=Gottfriedia acidiceleris TaxID=371036 RepID=UPI003D1B9628